MVHTVAPGQSRLQRIITGAVREPGRTLLVGVESVGKSTFASHAPNPIFLAVEEGASQIGVARVSPASFQDVIADLKALLSDPHDYQTVVIDTMDALEPLIWSNVAARKGKESIEDLGYGKGYTFALDEFSELTGALDNLRKGRGMEVILIAHAVAKNFANPSGPDYKRYEPALQEKAANLIKGWVDNILFATFESAAVGQDGKIVTNVQDAKGGKFKGVETGRRIMMTQRSAAWDAKNRYSLEPEMPFAYKAYAAGVERFWSSKKGYTAPALVYEECLAALAVLGPDPGASAARAFVESHKGDGPALNKALERIKELQKGEA
jgi:AAA domain